MPSRIHHPVHHNAFRGNYTTDQPAICCSSQCKPTVQLLTMQTSCTPGYGCSGWVTPACLRMYPVAPILRSSHPARPAERAAVICGTGTHLRSNSPRRSSSARKAQPVRRSDAVPAGVASGPGSAACKTSTDVASRVRPAPTCVSLRLQINLSARRGIRPVMLPFPISTVTSYP